MATDEDTPDRPPMPEPTTMDGVLALSADDMRRIEPWLYQGDLSAKRMIKGMIRILDGELTWQGEENSMSLRGLWYSGVKTALQNAFPEKWADPGFDANRRYAQYLSDALSEMVKNGEVTYRGLNIVDDSRQREIVSDTIEDDKILFVEKEAAFRRLEPIQEVFELTLVSGGGWEATALIEDLSNNLAPGQSYQLYVLSDYDPTGFRIAEDFAKRSRTLGVNITDVTRIGINPDQVSDRVRNQERFRPPVENDYDEQWMAEYAIEGVYGLELEAIGEIGEGGRPLRRIVVDAMRDDLRFRAHIRQRLNVAVASAVKHAADDVLDDVTANFMEALLDHNIGTMEPLDFVDRLYHLHDAATGDWSVRAATDLDAAEGMAEHTLVPQILDAEHFVEAAVEAEGRPLGAYGNVRTQLRDDLWEAIRDGDIDLNALIGDGDGE